MPIRLWACVNGICSTLYFLQRDRKDGRCPRCGQQGERVIWTVRGR